MLITRLLAGFAAAAVMAGATSGGALADLHTDDSDDQLLDLVDLDEIDLIDSDDQIGEDQIASEDPSGSSQVQRAAGPERVTTSVAASQEFRAAAETAVLATAGDFPDALAAAALASQRDAPVLLTRSDELPEAVAAELERLGVDRTVLLGGTGVIGQPVVDDLEDRGYRVDRIAGDHRYDTARQLGEAVGPSDTGEVLVALGAHDDPDRAWPDAVAAGALAASRDELPTLLTAHDHLPDATRQALADLEADRALLIGGESAIPSSVEAEIEGLGVETERLADTSRYGTSVQVAQEASDRNAAAPHPLVVATGEDFPDALAAGALAGALDAPVALTPSSELAGVVDQYVRDHPDLWDGAVVLGGPAAASELVVGQLEAALDGSPRPEPEPEADDGDDADAEGEAERTTPEDRDDGDSEVVATFEGEASWYGSDFHGQQTACGETFDMYAHTAAHPELPCGTRVRVTNTENGRQVTVRINDRGPYAGDRVIDLSRAAAEEIGMRASGTVWVRGEVLAE